MIELRPIYKIIITCDGKKIIPSKIEDYIFLNMEIGVIVSFNSYDDVKLLDIKQNMDLNILYVYDDYSSVMSRFSSCLIKNTSELTYSFTFVNHRRYPDPIEATGYIRDMKINSIFTD